MSFSWESDSNDSGPFMNAALLSSHNDTLINNVISLLFSSLLCLFYEQRDIFHQKGYNKERRICAPSDLL